MISTLCILLVTRFAMGLSTQEPTISPTQPIVQYQTAPELCVFPFSYKSVTYYGCTGASPWCALDNEYVTGRWESCDVIIPSVGHEIELANITIMDEMRISFTMKVTGVPSANVVNVMQIGTDAGLKRAPAVYIFETNGFWVAVSNNADWNNGVTSSKGINNGGEYTFVITYTQSQWEVRINNQRAYIDNSFAQHTTGTSLPLYASSADYPAAPVKITNLKIEGGNTGSFANPTIDPTSDPTADPTADPTDDPTTDPTDDPTTDPTADPSIDPTGDPTSDPTLDPSTDPSTDPTIAPTSDPTSEPTSDPISEPTSDPIADTTIYHTLNPTTDPSVDPTIYPTVNHTLTLTTQITTTEDSEQTCGDIGEKCCFGRECYSDYAKCKRGHCRKKKRRSKKSQSGSSSNSESSSDSHDHVLQDAEGSGGKGYASENGSQNEVNYNVVSLLVIAIVVGLVVMIAGVVIWKRKSAAETKTGHTRVNNADYSSDEAMEAGEDDGNIRLEVVGATDVFN